MNNHHNQLFGHLTPALLMHEMHNLSAISGEERIANLNVIITHMKPEGNNEVQIKRKLLKENALQLQFIFPHKGMLINL